VARRASRASFPWLLALALAAVLLIGALTPRGALGDGDPASDVLLGENVFYPYTPPVSPAIQKRLDAVTVAAKRAGFPIKVALIASPVDLGVIPDLFGHPQKYADFLDQEISFQTRQPLLVVMAAGYGVQGVGRAVRDAASALHKPAGMTSTDLAQAAITAVAKLGAAAGHPVQGAPASSTEGSSGSSTGLVIALAAAAALIAAALVFLRRRQRTTS
jgi:MYXO-CTERM domain-containing protein